MTSGKCSRNPYAPHGFDRNASHSENRYVCECEGFSLYEACNDLHDIIADIHYSDRAPTKNQAMNLWNCAGAYLWELEENEGDA